MILVPFLFINLIYYYCILIWNTHTIARMWRSEENFREWTYRDRVYPACLSTLQARWHFSVQVIFLSLLDQD